MCRDSDCSCIAGLTGGGKKYLINNSLKVECANVGYCECGKKSCGRALAVQLSSSSYLGGRGGGKLCENTSGPHSARHPGGMVLWAAILFLHGAGFVGSMTGIPGVPENITVMFLNPTSVRVSWSTSQVDQVEKYDVTYKPTDARNFTIDREDFSDRNETIDQYYESYNETYNETFSLTYYEPYNETYDESYRMVRLVAGNSDAVTLSDLQADTQYQLVITAVRGGKKYRSRPIVFRTLEPPRTSPQQDAAVTGGPIPPPPPSSQQPHAYIQVRGVEVGIVVMVLLVWAGAIALFFNRWGKIRMLLPYQPDYKEQLKVPGTGVCTAANAACTQHSSQHACSQVSRSAESLAETSEPIAHFNHENHLHWSSHRVDSLDSTGGAGGMAWPRASRPRVNSAIDVAGFLSQEFLRRHGSTSRLCRKVRSADNLPLASSGHQDCEQTSCHDECMEMDRERDIFLPRKSEDDEKFGETDFESKRQSSSESGSKDHTDAPLIESYHQQSTSRSTTPGNSTTTSISGVGRRFGGWRFGGSHEYVRCPVRQPASIDERINRRSCEPDFTRVKPHHPRYLHHCSTDTDSHSRSCDYTRYTIEPNIETQHFGLPILSVSEPSPPDEKNRLDDYL
ncbi:uncharacterized protein LOC135160704 isoform X4 [Diachasmimorpha longicaudata]|uniref:uncharacterized protein LOC135160704 isoform X4 n=1 Tax=Diachasmimorpha longicaudata TaxID=58733 RepID=UPI0030B87DD5